MHLLRNLDEKSVALYPRLAGEDDPISYRLMWCDLEDWFHNHLKQAMRMSALMIEATARHHALHGFDEVQVFQGEICWKEDPKLAGFSDEDLETFGYPNRFERNPDGSLIPLTVRRKPSDQLVLKMLAAHFPRAYGDKVQHQHSGGIISVMRVGRDGKMRPQTPPRENPEDEFVVSADAGNLEPEQMKIGLVVGEVLEPEELERRFGGPKAVQDVEFQEVDDEEAGSAVATEAKPAK
jgi:hypothetical protein